MIFASKSSRDLNQDLFPYVGSHGSRHAYPGTLNGDALTHDPRPEFDHIQHNEPNPVLVAFREHNIEAARPGSWESHATPEGWLEYTEGHYQGPRECIAHARRVLTRLANLTKEN